MKSSLEHKTIRPGSLNGFSYYHSDRHPDKATESSKPTKNKGSYKLRFSLVVLALLVGGWFMFLRGDEQSSKTATTSPNSSKSTVTAPAATKSTENKCAGSNEGKLLLISISKRHMWACEGAKTVYESPVITGMEKHASTLTPVGTYHIYAKTTDTTLTGTDETGSWSDPVQFWMPFLDNQYGTYGFHDATWRPDSEFGRVDPNSEEASHGCVELPLASSKWVYDWAPVGTTVTVES